MSYALIENIKQQRAQRIRAWVDNAQKVASHSDSEARSSHNVFAVPGLLREQLDHDIQALQRRFTRGYLADPRLKRDRTIYRESLNYIYSMAHECHKAWAKTMLQKHPQAADVLRSMIAAMASISPADKRPVLAESEIMLRLYILDMMMNVNELKVGAHDWCEHREAYQTEYSWISYGYLLALRGLYSHGTLRAEPVGNGSLRYHVNPLNYNEAIDQLEKILGEDFATDFTLISIDAAKESEKANDETQGASCLESSYTWNLR